MLKSLTPGQQIIKIVNEELTELMGGEQSKIAASNRPPTVIMMVEICRVLVKRPQQENLPTCSGKNITVSLCL